MREITSTAPIRVCDVGGWTDTWFAGHGAVCNIAVEPCVEVGLRATSPGRADVQVTMELENYAESYAYDVDAPPGRHRLLEAAVREVRPPAGLAVHVSVRSGVPPGASTGTSAAVTVALVAALGRLRGDTCSAHQVATTAHRIEVERLGLQSGIQDQLCAAYGGVSFIEMEAYPHAQVAPVAVAETTWAALDERLVVFFLGRTHVSSEVHLRVIAGLRRGEGTRALDELRALAPAARDALTTGDLEAYGACLVANTEAQRALHPALVSAQAQAVFDLARAQGALGWKVNGAGGEGGSVSVLLDAGTDRDALVASVADADPLVSWVPTRLSRGGAEVREVGGRGA